MPHLLLAGAIFFCLPCLPNDEPQAAEFWNGKDLAGWKGLPGHWTVKDGVLTGTTHPDGRKSNTFLHTEKEHGDFELTFQAKLTGEGPNSGLQFRSAILDAERCALKGPQADMATGYWGSLFGEHHAEGNKHVMLKQCDWKKMEGIVKKNDFNDVSIRCVGQHVTIKINGTTTVDDDFPTLPAKGLIGFQLHQGKPMEAIFRDIKFKAIEGK